MREIQSYEERAASAADVSENLHTLYFRARNVLRSFWWIILLTTCLGVFVMAYLEFTKPANYESSASLILENYQINSSSNNVITEQFQLFGTIRETMGNPRLQNDAHNLLRVRRSDVKPEAVRITVERQPDAAIFIVKATGPKPDYTQLFLDALLETFKKFRKDSRGDAIGDAIKSRRDKLQAISVELENLEREFTLKHGEVSTAALEETTLSLTKETNILSNRINELTSQITLIKGLTLEQFISGGTTIFSDEPELIRGVFETASPYLEASKKLEDAKAEEKVFSVNLKPKHPKIIAFRSEIATLENRVNIHKANTQRKIEDLRSVLELRLAALTSQLTAKQDLYTQSNSKRSKFNAASRIIEERKMERDSLAKEIRDLELGQPNTPEIIRVMNSASPARTVPSQLATRILLGAFGGFFFGAGILFLLGYLDNRLVSADDIRRHFEHPVIGVIPSEQRSSAGQIELLKPRDRRHIFSEACRTLRSSILFLHPGTARPKVILVTSAVPDEGKSTIASNLAVSLALAHSRVILVDADLRRGRMHRVFPDVPKTPGLSEVILDPALNFQDHVKATNVENLSILPCGAYPERPGELFLSVRFEQVLAEIAKSYDYVVLDTAPILATDDTTGFAAKADAVIFTVRSSFTQMRQVRAAIDRLRLRGANIFGFVLNRVDLRGADYYYYNKYNKYYALAEDAAKRESSKAAETPPRS